MTARAGTSAEFLAAIARDPTWYAQKLDLERDAALLIEMSKAAYEAASFLDDRILTQETRGGYAPLADIRRALMRAPGAPLHFIFHSGHVGSTLLSRLLEATGDVLALREPLPLRTLAAAHDALMGPQPPLSAGDFNMHLETQIRLWRRGYPDTQAVIVKATSSAARIAGALMNAHPGAMAVYLNLAAEPYLAVLLAGENTPTDLKGMEAERMLRLQRLLGARIRTPATLGELAAMTWLTERLTQGRLTAEMGERVLSLDFDDFLTRPGEATLECAAHLGLRFVGAALADIEASPLLNRYSKAPEYEYSPRMRAEIVAHSRAENAAEIRNGLAWLGRLAAAHPPVAAVFDLR